jgi:hypothetical protein
MVAMLLIVSFCGNSFGKISEELVKKEVENFRKNVTGVIDMFLRSADSKTLERLKAMLPTGPKTYGLEIFGSGYEHIESDVFFPQVEKNAAAIEVLEKKLKRLKMGENKKTRRAGMCACKCEGKEGKCGGGKSSKVIEKLGKLLESQKSIQDEWNRFFEQQWKQ